MGYQGRFDPRTGRSGLSSSGFRQVRADHVMWIFGRVFLRLHYRLRPVPSPSYSARRDVAGSTAAARRAGIQAAMRETESTAVAAAR